MQTVTLERLQVILLILLLVCGRQFRCMCLFDISRDILLQDSLVLVLIPVLWRSTVGSDGGLLVSESTSDCFITSILSEIKLDLDGCVFDGWLEMRILVCSWIPSEHPTLLERRVHSHRGTNIWWRPLLSWLFSYLQVRPCEGANHLDDVGVGETCHDLYFLQLASFSIAFVFDILFIERNALDCVDFVVSYALYFSHYSKCSFSNHF